MENYKETAEKLKKWYGEHKQLMNTCLRMFLMMPEKVQKAILFGSPEDIENLLKEQES